MTQELRGFLDRFRDDLDNQHSYYCSLDVKFLYTTCDMRKAVEIVMELLKDNPNSLPPPISPEGIRSLLNFSLDNGLIYSTIKAFCPWQKY